MTSVISSARSPLIPLKKGDFETKTLIAPFSRGRRQRGILLGAKHALNGAATASVVNAARSPLIPLQKGEISQLVRNLKGPPFQRGGDSGGSHGPT